MREPGGHFVVFDVGGAATFPRSINNSGTVAGYSAGSGFIRSPAGVITTFTFGSPFLGVVINDINVHGDIVG